MDKYNTGYLKEEDDQIMELPPGFRFHPTDEELVTHYLFPKVRDASFVARAIGEVDLNKSEPWELPWRAKLGEKEWYFFCVRDRKYPTGLRTNRATEAGYWKATGKDKEIYRMKVLVGMKKTLVFYKGRAPKGEKTNWVMHEYRLEGNYSSSNLPKSAKNEWVICRIFEKNSSGKKTDITELAGYASKEHNIGSSQLPQLMDSSPYTVRDPRSLQGDSSQVSSFSYLLTKNQVPKQETLNNFDSLMPVSYPSNPSNPSSFTFPSNYSKPNLPSSSLSAQVSEPIENWSYHDSDQSILRLLLDNQGPSLWSSKQPEYSQESGLSTDMSPNLSNREMGQVDPSTSGGPVDIDCLWTH